MNVQAHLVVCKTVWSKFNTIALFPKIPVWQWYMECPHVCNKLDGTKIANTCFVAGRDNCQSLRFRLAAVIPAAKIAAHE